MAQKDSTPAAGGSTEPTKRRTNPFQFVQEVRQEVSKVTWPSRNETTVTTIMVLIFVVIMAIFFFFVDMGLRFVIESLLSLGS